MSYMINLKLDDNTEKELRELAKRHDRPMANLIRYLIKEFYKSGGDFRVFDKGVKDD